MLSTPVLLTLVSALAGAVIATWTLRRIRFAAWAGALLGAAAGTLGSMLFMVPLNYCMFDATRLERDPQNAGLNQGFGIFLTAIGVGVALFAVTGFLRWQHYRRNQRNIGFAPAQQGRFRGVITPWLLLLPTLTILVLFLYYPSLDTLRVSTLLRFVGIDRTRFVCVNNFISLLQDASYLRSFGISFVIAGSIVALGLFLSLMIATVAMQQVPGIRIYRTFLIWPYAISPAIAGIIFSRLFDPITGGVNLFWERAFGFKLPLLNDPYQATFAVILASVWKTLGFGILFYIAGLQNVSGDLKEAASIDGANVVQRFRFITVPLLSPITFFLLITTMTYAFFDIYGTIDLLTTGGPSGTTSVLIYKIIDTGKSDLGLASAQSIILFILVIGLTTLQFRSTGRRVNYMA